MLTVMAPLVLNGDGAPLLGINLRHGYWGSEPLNYASHVAKYWEKEMWCVRVHEIDMLRKNEVVACICNVHVCIHDKYVAIC